MTTDIQPPTNVQQSSTETLPENMSVLVTGASGLLGRAVYRHLKNKGFKVTGIAFSRSSETLHKLDLTDTRATENFIQSTLPNVIIHCAAERRPDRVAQDPKTAEKLNVDATRTLVELCRENSIPLVYISTDYVFDGTKPLDALYEVDDETHPINLYGQLKRNGEQVVRTLLDRSLILRVPVLYGPTLYPEESAINGLLNIVRQSHTVAVDDLQVRFPTHVEDVAKVLEQLLLRHPFPNGIVQYSSHEPWTKFGICQFFAEILQRPISHLVPSTQVDHTRPAHVHMSTQTLHNLGIQICPTCFKEWFQFYIKDQILKPAT